MTSTLSVVTREQSNLELASAATKAHEYARESRSASTIKAYASDWRDFENWCNRGLVNSLPAEPSTVAMFIADLADTAKVSTISRRLAAISKAHQARGHESPASMKYAAVSDVLNGIKRKQGVRPAGKTPLLTVDMRRLIQAAPDSLLGTRDIALLAFGFCGWVPAV